MKIVPAGFVSYSQLVWESVDEVRFNASPWSSILFSIQDGSRPWKKGLPLVAAELARKFPTIPFDFLPCDANSSSSPRLFLDWLCTNYIVLVSHGRSLSSQSIDTLVRARHAHLSNELFLSFFQVPAMFGSQDA